MRIAICCQQGSDFSTSVYVILQGTRMQSFGFGYIPWIYIIFIISCVTDGLNWDKYMPAGQGYPVVEYVYYTSHVTWNDARSTCRSIGGDLAKIDSEQTMDVIQETVQNSDIPELLYNDYWIGLTEMTNGSTVWASDCSELTYTGNFVSSWQDSRLCYYMSASNHIGYLAECNSNHTFLCERTVDAKCTSMIDVSDVEYYSSVVDSGQSCNNICLVTPQCIGSLFVSPHTCYILYENGTSAFTNGTMTLKAKSCIQVTLNTTVLTVEVNTAVIPELDCGTSTTTTALPTSTETISTNSYNISTSYMSDITTAQSKTVNSGTNTIGTSTEQTSTTLGTQQYNYAKGANTTGTSTSASSATRSINELTQSYDTTTVDTTIRSTTTNVDTTIRSTTTAPTTLGPHSDSTTEYKPVGTETTSTQSTTEVLNNSAVQSQGTTNKDMTTLLAASTPKTTLVNNASYFNNTVSSFPDISTSMTINQTSVTQTQVPKTTSVPTTLSASNSSPPSSTSTGVNVDRTNIQSQVTETMTTQDVTTNPSSSFILVATTSRKESTTLSVASLQSTVNPESTPTAQALTTLGDLQSTTKTTAKSDVTSQETCSCDTSTTTETLTSTETSSSDCLGQNLSSTVTLQSQDGTLYFCHETMDPANLTISEIEERAIEISNNLTVAAKTTSAYLRTLTSVEDRRTSAVVMGTVGIICVTIPIVLLLLSDLQFFYGSEINCRSYP